MLGSAYLHTHACHGVVQPLEPSACVPHLLCCLCCVPVGESEAGLSGIFAAAAALSPSIVFIDEIDAIAPSRDAAGHGGASGHTAAAGGGGSAAGEAAARVLTQLLVLMDGLGSTSGGSSVTAAAAGAGGSSGSNASSGQQQSGVQAATAARVVVIAATNRPSAVDPALRRPGRWVLECLCLAVWLSSFL